MYFVLQFLIKTTFHPTVMIEVLLSHFFVLINDFVTEFLGRTEVRIASIISEKKNSFGGPLTKKMQLLETESGMVTLRLDLQMF